MRSGAGPGASRASSKQPSPKTSVQVGPTSQPLKVRIVSARGLRNADWMPGSGKSDVYCVCSIIGKPHMTSRTITCNNTLEPAWNHEAEFEDYQNCDCLQFDLMDKDISFLKKDDHLGRAMLSSSRFYPHGFDGEIPVSDASASSGACLKVFIPPAPPGSSMSVEKMLESVMTAVGEVCAGQQQLRQEVRSLHEEVHRLQSRVDAEVLTVQDVPRDGSLR
uniref:C2 domain-containing protein n=1 Tax=Alexandrium catenella TaxID=2925 RepID=A0A7S1RHW8_ALECA